MNTSNDVMNVNMVEHQRSILAVLGIDIWMPKVNAPVQNFHSTLYRDQEVLNPSSSSALAITFDVKPPIEALTQLPLEQAGSKQTQISSQEKIRQTATQLPQSVDEPHLAQNMELQDAISIAPFELQVCCTDRYVIVVDVTHLSENESSLWDNIQRVDQAQFYDLKWPFPLEPLQDGRGAAIYVQGFIDVLRGEKKLLSLGELPHYKTVDVLIMPSLSAMISQPILKRTLWENMR